MKTLFFIFLLISTSWGCKETTIEPTMNFDKVSLSGEWHYVGNFSRTSNYSCTVCSTYDYEKSLYKITFKEDGTFDARINRLIGNGTYVGKPNANATATNYFGDVDITNLQILNKPPETEADGEFQQKLLDTGSFNQNTKANNTFGYDELMLNSKNVQSSEYLLFVRKKQ